MTDKTKTDIIKQFNEQKTLVTTPVEKKDSEVVAKKALQDKEQRRVEALQKQEEDKKKQEEAEKNAHIVDLVKMQTQKAQDITTQATETPRRFIENLPTPGGLATIIVILLFFTFAVIPVNSAGDTRLKLLWLTLIGRTTLVGSDTSKNKPASRGPIADVVQGVVIPSEQTAPSNVFFIDIPNNVDIFGTLGFNFE